VGNLLGAQPGEGLRLQGIWKVILSRLKRTKSCKMPWELGDSF